MKYTIINNEIVDTETNKISDFVIKLGDTLTFTPSLRFFTIEEICALKKNKQVIFPDSMLDLFKNLQTKLKLNANCSLHSVMHQKENKIMTKEIKMEGSKYTIEYDPTKQWGYRIKRYGEDVSHKLKTNAMNDLVFHLTENIEKGVALEGITVIKK